MTAITPTAEAKVYGYITFYKGKRHEVYATSTLDAQTKAAEFFKAKKRWEVDVYLAEVDGEDYVHTAVN